MAQRTVIKTPFPSPSTIAKGVGLSRARFLAIARELGLDNSAKSRSTRKVSGRKRSVARARKR